MTVETELADLIDNSNRTVIQLPELPKHSEQVSRIIESTFEVDILELYEEIDGKLDLDDSLNPEEVRVALNRVESRGLKAHQTYSICKVNQDQVELQLSPIEAKMRAAAIDALTNEKNIGKRRKQVTEADVIAKMYELFPLKFSELNDLKNKGRQLVEHLKKVATLWENKSRTLSSLNKK